MKTGNLAQGGIMSLVYLKTPFLKICHYLTILEKLHSRIIWPDLEFFSCELPEGILLKKKYQQMCIIAAANQKT